MAVFDESKVITALHPEKAEVGKKYWYSDSLQSLKAYVESNVIGCAHKLTYIDSPDDYPFKFGEDLCQFIYPYEEPPKQRMTNRQFCEWYNRGNGQWKWKDSSQCHTDYSYSETTDNKEVDEDIHIRSWGSTDWQEPTFDIYERDCKKEN